MKQGSYVSVRIAGVLTTAAALALVSAAPALADTTIGQAAGNHLCLAGFVAADPSYRVPAGGGVITSFSYADNSGNAGAHLDFQVLQPRDDGSYTIVGHTGLQTLAGTDGVESFPTHIPVTEGEVLGYYESGTNNCLETGGLDQVPAQFVGSDPALGTTLFGMGVSPIQGVTLNESANLAPPGAAPLTATDGAISGTEGQQLSSAVGTFSDPDAQPVGDYSATIDWGDGSSSAGTVSQTGTGEYEVDGSHTYTEAGSYPVSVQIGDSDGTAATVSSSAAVADAPLSATGLGDASSPVTTTPSFAGTVANVSDENPLGSAADLTATIDWGDGSTSQGTVSGSGGSYTVAGSHSYGTDGPHAVTVHVADGDGSADDAATRLLVYEHAGRPGASFVIGDGAAGAQVYFWGGQWAEQNPLNGGQGPRAFMGFAQASAPGCGATFTARPGSSSAPPAGVPAYMAVAVTGAVAKSGSAISGTVQKVVIVRTDPGYAPDAAGTGQVVATVCG